MVEKDLTGARRICTDQIAKATKGRKRCFLPFALRRNMEFQKSSGKFVGVDAYIDPANKTDYTKLYGEFDASQRVDVGIDPYA